jgi:hypothetical protein
MLELRKARLKHNGWNVKADNTYLKFTKEELIQEIRCLENNYCNALESNDNQHNLLLKQEAEIQLLLEEKVKLEDDYIESVQQWSKLNNQCRAEYENTLKEIRSEVQNDN